jgi:hypothetical protein
MTPSVCASSMVRACTPCRARLPAKAVPLPPTLTVWLVGWTAAAGLEAEFAKCLSEGKSMIVEGLHAHPRLLQGDHAGAVVLRFVLAVPDAAEHWQLYREWHGHQQDSGPVRCAGRHMYIA